MRTDTRPDYYRDQQAWRDLLQTCAWTTRPRPRRSSGTGAGNRVHLDRYRNPTAPAKVVLHHGVGTNGRQMSLILGAPLARRGFETVALDNLASATA